MKEEEDEEGVEGGKVGRVRERGEDKRRGSDREGVGEGEGKGRGGRILQLIFAQNGLWVKCLDATLTTHI